MVKMFRKTTPGIGKITFSRGVKAGDKRPELRILKWMIQRYGGNYRVLAERKQRGVKTPDADRNNNELIEIKSSKTLTSFKNRLAEAVQQLLYKNNKIAKVSAKYIVIEALGVLAQEKQNMTREVRLRLSGKDANEITGVIIKCGRQTIEIKG